MAFVDTEKRSAGEVQQKVGRLKLSEAVKRGCELSRPTKDLEAKAWVTWREDKCFSCLIGAAWIGFEGTDKLKYFTSGPMYWEVAARSGVAEEILRQAAFRYEQEDQSREQVADWLEAQGL